VTAVAPTAATVAKIASVFFMRVLHSKLTIQRNAIVMVAPATAEQFDARAEPNEKERPAGPLFSWIS
jgi:hypothetical protein